tara:strand:+ start:2177 stop:2362 length:186 start_codon:yes stop_codon:yes gene_type:complete
MSVVEAFVGSSAAAGGRHQRVAFFQHKATSWKHPISLSSPIIRQFGGLQPMALRRAPTRAI